MRTARLIPEALRALTARPLALAAALAGGAAAGLSARAAGASSARLFVLGDPHTWWRAALAWAWGGALAALFGGGALAVALAAASGEEPRVLLSAALRRGVAILSLQAVEQVIYGALALAAIAPIARLGERPPATAALCVAAAAAGPLLVALLAAAAFRVAVAEAGAGLLSHFALLRGLELALTRLPSLVALCALAAVATAALWIAALALGFLHGGAAIAALVAALRGALVVAAGAWLYAALGRFSRAAV